MDKFHIHVDALKLSQEFENFLIENLNFWQSDFAGHPEGVPHFEAPIHLTTKTETAKEFKAIFESIQSYLEQNPEAIEGYVEGEYIPLDIDIKEQPFNPEVEVPCRFELTDLDPGTFREDEIHVTLDRDKSDPRLIENLRSMGFFSAYMDKSFGTVEILTVQGSIKQIQQLLPQILHYLKDAGGSVKCSVKEERIVRWWVSSSNLSLPPVIMSA